MKYSWRWQAENMNKTFLIFRHEFIHTLKRTGFIVLTLFVPLVALLAIGVIHVTSGIVKPPAGETKIGYVDETGTFSQFTKQGNILFVSYDSTPAATQALINKDITEYCVFPADFLSTGTINLYSMQTQLAPAAADEAAIQSFITNNLLNGKVPDTTIQRVENPVNVVSITLTSTGTVAPQQNGITNLIVPGIFSLLLALSLVFSSTYLIQSLSQEKENRLMEILLSSVSSRQLLTGKVLGLGAAGLVQVVVWVISLPLLLNLASSSLGGVLTGIQVPAAFWVLGIIYFILGYLMFAVISASVAAVTSTLQEAQSLSGIYSIFNVVPLWAISLLILFPNSPVWIALSIFPFTAPVMVMLRLGATGVPVWQLVVSTAVLALFIVGGLLLAARLLRVYMLMYGKRPGLETIIRNLRNA